MTTKLFFAELSFQFDDSKLSDIIHQNGLQYESIRLLHRGGSSLGHGFIMAKNNNDARNIISILNGLELGGRRLKCEYARETLEMKVESKSKALEVSPSKYNTTVNSDSDNLRKEHKATLVKNTIYIANLPIETTEADVLKLFRDYHPKNVRIVTDSDGISRGFGFIEFDDEENSLKALEEVKGLIIGERLITLRLARKQRDVAMNSETATTLFVARVPLGLSETDLYQAFEAFHPKKCHFIKNRESSTFGYGFIVFSTPQDCKNALEFTKQAGFEIGGSKVVVEYALS